MKNGENWEKLVKRWNGWLDHKQNALFPSSYEAFQFLSTAKKIFPQVSRKMHILDIYRQPRVDYPFDD